MKIKHLIGQSSHVPSHAYAAFLTVLISGWQLRTPKYTKIQIYTAYTWINLMLLVSITSFLDPNNSTIRWWSCGKFLFIWVFGLFSAWSLLHDTTIKKHLKVMRIFSQLHLFSQVPLHSSQLEARGKSF